MTPQFFEAIMLCCFGASWPFSILKTWRTKTCAGKSFLFLILINLGYISAMIGKLLQPELQWVFYFYLFNFVITFSDFCLCVHYARKNKR